MTETVTTFLSAVAALVAHALGLAGPLPPLCLVLPLPVATRPETAQVPLVPALPGDYTPETGAMP